MAEKRPPAAKKAAERKRADWEAVERDYRTGRFTLRELAALHGVTHTTIARRAERDGWTKDLTEAIRQATNAKVIEAAVQQQCTSAHQNATDAVLGAAELNKQIILGHRTRLVQLNEDALLLRTKLTSALDVASEPREIVAVAGGFEALGRLTKLVIDKEREAFGLNDADAAPTDRREAIPIVFVEADG